MDTIFSEQEQNVRTWWLRLFIFQLAMPVFSWCYREPPVLPANLPFNWSLHTFGLILSVLALSWNLGIYYFSYEKQGTKLLTLSLIGNWIAFSSFGISIFAILFSFVTGTVLPFQDAAGNTVPFSIFVNDHSIGERLLTLISIALLVPHYIFTVRLRRINRSRQKIQIIDSRMAS